MDRGQPLMNGVIRRPAETGEIEPLFGDRRRQSPQCPDFRPRQSRLTQRLVIEGEKPARGQRIDRLLNTAPNRTRARNRELLADNNSREPRKSRRSPAQRRIADQLMDTLHIGTFSAERLDAVANIFSCLDDALGHFFGTAVNMISLPTISPRATITQ